MVGGAFSGQVVPDSIRKQADQVIGRKQQSLGDLGSQLFSSNVGGFGFCQYITDGHKTMGATASDRPSDQAQA